MKSMKFDEKVVKNIFLKCWSSESSTRWSADNPTRGQCSVTAIVVLNTFGGEILKTIVDGKWHFYNRIEGIRYDFTVDQFRNIPEYLDIISSADEAIKDTNRSQFEYLSNKFAEEITKIFL